MGSVQALRRARFGVGTALGLALTTLLACALLVPAGAHAADCANEALREDQTSATLPGGTTFLPGCMALEMVSPPVKFNQYAIDPNFSANGERVQFISIAALAETPKQGSITDQYLATRTSSGWQASPTATPAELTAGYGSSATPCTYSTDLSRWTTFAATANQARLGVVTAFADGIAEPFHAIGPTMTPLEPIAGTRAVNLGGCEGGSVDASRELFSIAEARYLNGDPTPPALSSGPRNVYEAYLDAEGDPAVELLQRDGTGKEWGEGCGAKVGSMVATLYRGSVSPDASRIYFSTRPNQPEGVSCNAAANRLRILKRSRTPGGIEIEELISSECDRVAPPCSTADGDDIYLGASQEGTRVYFSTARQLADTDLDSTADLYLYDESLPVGQRLAQASAGEDPTPGEGAQVLGMADFAGDGSHAYFIARGVLDFGGEATAGSPNLYLYQRDAAHPDGRIVFIATLSEADEGTWDRGGAAGQDGNAAIAAPVLGADEEDQALGGDGHLLVFHSRAGLTVDDTDGGRADEYLYDSDADTLTRVSAAAPGGSDNGAFDVAEVFAGKEAGPQSLFFGRWISEDGSTIVFSTAEALDPADTNGTTNAYVWREGEVYALPFGKEPAVSMDGDQVAFVSDGQLLPEDGDASKDVYVARAEGGFPLPVEPETCSGEGCRKAVADPAPQSFQSSSIKPGNPKSVVSKHCPRGKRKVRRGGKSRCVKPKPAKRGNANRNRQGNKQGGRR